MVLWIVQSLSLCRKGIYFPRAGADTQYHQPLPTEGVLQKVGPSESGGATTGVGGTRVAFPAAHNELQQWNFSCLLPSTGVAEIAILRGLF